MDTNNSPSMQWTKPRALALMAACLVVGIAGGWGLHGARSVAPFATAKATSISAPVVPTASPANQAQTPEQLKAMADNEAAPLLAKLNADPKNSDLLTGIGNLYYDARQYPVAVDYYGRALKIKPSDAAVRTDMATAYWYIGDADRAIAEFNTALKYAPDTPNTLFNLGLVKWEGKHDAAGAIADWKKVLAKNPDYAAKDQVEKMLSEVEKQTAKADTKG